MTQDGTATLRSVLVAFPCDLCGGSATRILQPAAYTGDEPLDEIVSTYRSSSEVRLMDQLSQCTACGLVFASPRLPDDLLIQGYSEAIDERHFAQAEFREATFARALDTIIAANPRMAPTSGQRILDIGCAGGSFLAAARARGFTATGVEPARWLAEQGRRHYRVDIKDGVFNPRDFDDSPLHAVSLWDVLEHVSSPRELLSDIHGALRPGGYLIVNVPTIDSVAARVLRRHWPFYLNVHLYYFTATTLARYFAATGFRMTSSRSFWQTLPASYLAERSSAGRIRESSLPGGLAKVPIRYNMGQRTFVAVRD